MSLATGLFALALIAIVSAIGYMCVLIHSLQRQINDAQWRIENLIHEVIYLSKLHNAPNVFANPTNTRLNDSLLRCSTSILDEMDEAIKKQAEGA